MELSATVVELPTGQSQVTISFPTQVGKNYTVEFRTDLSPNTSWQSLPGAPHNSGSITETNLTIQRYYRLRISQ